MKCLIGADPEFFVKKDGKFVSAYGLVEGTKTNPQTVAGGAVQVDGMALEFNINPAANLREFKDNIKKVIGGMRKLVPLEYDFVFEPVAKFGNKLIAEQPEEARRLGCDPDFNAWNNGLANPQPNAGAAFRTASGHVHIGWTEDEDITNPDHIEACVMLAKQLDFYLGALSVVIDPDNTRRKLYGKAGAFRPKPYGLEYRVMSNAWLRKDWTIAATYDLAKKAFDSLIEGHPRYGMGEHMIVEIINAGNWRKAYDYVGRYYEKPELYNTYVEREMAENEAKRKILAQKLNIPNELDAWGKPVKPVRK